MDLTHGGYIFIYKDNPELYYKSKELREKKNLKKKISKQKTILQFTKSNEFIREYTYQELTDDGFKLETVQACCCGQNKTAFGYKWKYKESTAS